jgi:hypothetical protein
VDLIPPGEQELGQVGPVLPGDAGDERNFHSENLPIELIEIMN